MDVQLMDSSVLSSMHFSVVHTQHLQTVLLNSTQQYQHSLYRGYYLLRRYYKHRINCRRYLLQCRQYINIICRVYQSVVHSYTALADRTTWQSKGNFQKHRQSMHLLVLDCSSLVYFLRMFKRVVWLTSILPIFLSRFLPSAFGVDNSSLQDWWQKQEDRQIDR